MTMIPILVTATFMLVVTTNSAIASSLSLSYPPIGTPEHFGTSDVLKRDVEGLFRLKQVLKKLVQQHGSLNSKNQWIQRSTLSEESSSSRNSKDSSLEPGAAAVEEYPDKTDIQLLMPVDAIDENNYKKTRNYSAASASLLKAVLDADFGRLQQLNGRLALLK